MKLPLAIVGTIGLILGSVSLAVFSPEPAPLPLAGPDDYRVERADCWEQDVFNMSTEVVTFAIQATLGNGHTSAVQTTGALRPGDGAHLHFFAEIWDQENFENGSVMHLTAVAEEQGCELTVRVAPTTEQPTGQLVTDRYHSR